ncbi:hypothetical protein H7J86_01825 [Mycobacterium hackensackense]|uniref:Rv1733c family protein n=1 Tax=Mycobacterium hackensackense TaxID=228909 RepID=UPI00226584C4|nr:hypothetical protein [Mycobacterium hackensackense]MCV7250893.1 hypothetical protein [Mycobacterium hackensackense]
MEIYPIGLGRRSGALLTSRNPLVRISDRIEALTTFLALSLVVLMTPVAGAVGTAVHDSNARLYAEQALTRHIVSATAQTDTETVVQRNQLSYVVRARWTAAGSEHTGLVPWPSPASLGDKTDIWVDARGENTVAPTPVRQAAVDAVGIALSLWLVVAGASAGFVWVVRCRLDRSRHSAWDRELATVVGGHGGRAPHQTDN